MDIFAENAVFHTLYKNVRYRATFGGMLETKVLNKILTSCILILRENAFCILRFENARNVL